MTRRDPRVDAYIEKSEPFARPILSHLRDVVHAACPEAEETLKWRCPHFMYGGAILCAMAAFKRHCVFGFRLQEQVAEVAKEEAMGQFGRIASIDDLPSKRALAGYIRKAMALHDAGVKRARPKTAPKPAPMTPAELAAALSRPKHARARKTWEDFTDAMRREYVQWIAEAKTQDTRGKRTAVTLEWLADGKQRNWKYMK